MRPRISLHHLLLSALLAASLLPLSVFLAWSTWGEGERQAGLQRRQQEERVKEAARLVEQELASAARLLAGMARLDPRPFAAGFEALAGGQSHFTFLAELAPDRLERRWPQTPSEPAADARLLDMASPFFGQRGAGFTGFVTDPYTGRTTVLFAERRGPRLLVGLLDARRLLGLARTHRVLVRDPSGAALTTEERGPDHSAGAKTPRGLIEHPLAGGWSVAAPPPEAGLEPAAGLVGAVLLLLAGGLAAAGAVGLNRRIAGPVKALTEVVQALPAEAFRPTLPAAFEKLPAELEALTRAVVDAAREAARSLAERDGRIVELSRQLDEARRNLGDANSRLAARTFIDDLTHLGNRRALDRRLSDWERASPETYLPLQALLFRLENHQRIRELYGPKAGDGVLTHVAAVLDQQSRPGDFVVRYGCNEFLLLLRRCPADTARQRAEAIRTAILERRPLVEGRPLPLELSVGLAGSESPLSGPAFTQLLEAATRAFEAPRPAPQPEQGA